MHITDEMLKVAVLKSVEAGLLPRRALKEDFSDAQEMMRMILQSTLNEISQTNDTKIFRKIAPDSKAAASNKKLTLITVEARNSY